MTIRGTILDKAKALTEGDRNATYGDPKINLECFADLISAYLRGKVLSGNAALKAEDGAVFMMLAKISRVAMNAQHADNFIDLAAYAAIAGELSYSQDRKVWTMGPYTGGTAIAVFQVAGKGRKTKAEIAAQKQREQEIVQRFKSKAGID